jgi:trimeric autotransporter adhesin
MFNACGRGMVCLEVWFGVVLWFYGPVFAQCDPPMPPPPPPDDGVVVYALNGQTVEADGLGDFLISNIAVPDLSPADGVGDDYLHLTGMRITRDGITYYYFNPNFDPATCPEGADVEAFRMKPGERFVFPLCALQATDIPPPLPESITVTTTGSPVIERGSNVQLVTTARLGDGTIQDVTLPGAWTTYRTSNEAIARVVSDDVQNPTGMLVQGVGLGTAFITATNGGATSVKQFSVIPPGGGVNTTVEGFVIRPDGSMVNGAAVAVQVYGGLPVLSGPDGDPSWPNGFFSIPLLLPDTASTIVAEATLQTETQTDYGVSPSVAVVPDGITDAGFIAIELFCDTPWSTAFGPTTLEGGGVLALTVFDDDGPGPHSPALYAGGKFDFAGGTPASRVARWDGQSWQPLGVGITTPPSGDKGEVLGLAAIDLNDDAGPSLYAFGSFLIAGGVAFTNKIARWDGDSWSDVGGGVGNSYAQVRAAIAHDDGTGNGTELYVGGWFTTAGPYDNQNDECLPGCISAQSIARWNPTTQTWSAVGGGFTDLFVKSVLALAVFNGELYAGGDFLEVEGQAIAHIAKWNGVNWSAVGEGLPGTVNSLVVYDEGSGPALYAGGDFFGASGNYVAKWDGSVWTPLGDGLNGEVNTLVGLNEGTDRFLYAAGSFTNIGSSSGAAARRIARWDGAAWTALGEGLESAGTALAVFDDGSGPAVHVGGEVCVGCTGLRARTFDENRRDHNETTVASAAHATPTRTPQRNKTKATAVRHLGYVVRWRDETWSALGLGLSDEANAAADGVHALIVYDDGSGPALIAGGNFKPPRGPCGGLPGTCGSPPQSNPPPFPTNAIAAFDGEQWTSLGSGMTKSGTNPPPAEVLALAAFDEDGPGGNPPVLFAGGDFELADGIAANNVARWDGTAWSAVGDAAAGNDIGGIVRALAVFDDDGAGSNPEALYAGGDFPGRVARWDPLSQTWTTLGSGISNGSVHALAVFNNELYVGGNFTNAGGIAAADYLARWNGTSWSAVQSSGSGVSAPVYALTVFDPDGDGPTPAALFVGGEFTSAGGVSANLVARWDGNSWFQVGPASDPGFGPTDTKVTSLFGLDNGQGRFLYAGGDFTESANGSLVLNCLAKWNPNPTVDSWSAVGSNEFGNGVDGVGTPENPVSVFAITVFDDGATGPALFAGGSFESAGGQFDQQTGACEPDTGCTPAANIAKLGCR